MKVDKKPTTKLFFNDASIKTNKKYNEKNYFNMLLILNKNKMIDKEKTTVNIKGNQ